jgi:hypothetical protein
MELANGRRGPAHPLRVRVDGSSTTVHVNAPTSPCDGVTDIASAAVRLPLSARPEHVPQLRGHDVRRSNCVRRQGTVRVIMRDAFGRTQELSERYYRSPRVLRRGNHQFRYTLGKPRIQTSGRLFAYEGLVGSASHRAGVTNVFTVGGMATVSDSLGVVGPCVAFRLPFGEFEMGGRVFDTKGAVATAGMGPMPFGAAA